MPPASAVNNSSNNAALQAAAKAEREEKLRSALKVFILRERQRKKEEFEAKIEEERLRKEREARERQNDMTLEQTRGQITKLDEKLTELRNQKQQLFLQLKKVLNEDENRKKQQKDNEIFAMHQALQQQANVATAQVFMPPVRVQHHQMPILTKPMSGNQPIKRGRSPSPPQHQGYYKGNSYGPPKHDDGRHARVLWNKPPSQYQNQGTLFYQTTSNAPPPPPQAQPDARLQGLYPYNMPLRQGYHLELAPNPSVPVSKNEPQSQKPPTQVFHINLDQPPISQSGSLNSNAQPQKPQVTMEKINERYHIEVKHDGPPGHGPPSHSLPEGVVYTQHLTDMPLHPNVMQISGNPPQNLKTTGSITQGYAPGRGSAHEQQMARQQQLSVLPGQPGQQSSQQQLHFPRHLY